MSALPPPADLLGLEDYQSWYAGQEATLLRVQSWLANGRRFLAACLPTGSGKSLIAVASALFSEKRTVILTATKALQDQYAHLFRGKLVDIRGRSNYWCAIDSSKTVDQAVCNTGYKCELKQGGCSYYDQLREAKAAGVVVTNYAYWLAATNLSQGLGLVDLLVLDEAHLAEGQLENFLTTTFTWQELRIDTPFSGETLDEWRYWAARRKAVLEVEMRMWEVNMWGAEDSSVALRATLRKLDALLEHQEWVWETNPSGVTFTPLWPGQSARSLLFSPPGFTAPKVLLMSATLTPKHLEMLGLGSDDVEWYEQPSNFPPANTPIVAVDATRVNHRTSDEDLLAWVQRIDQVIDRRSDRKGIIFTVSYDRSDLIRWNSRHTRRMLFHRQKDVAAAVENFKLRKDGSILVSPSIHTGYDFPDLECQWIIIAKIPYPDTQSPVAKRRAEVDKDWAALQAMQQLVQSSGRGTRSATDRCEVFVLDDNWRWFWPRYRKFAPTWFQARVISGGGMVPEVSV